MYEKSWKYYDAIYEPLKDYAVESDAVFELAAKAIGREPATWLDVACGTGLHAEHLSQMCDYSGVDLNPNFVDLSRKRAPRAKIYRGDMRTFDLGEKFDVVSCLFSAVGHMQTADELNQALARFAAHCKPDGVVIVETWVFPDVWTSGYTAVDTGRRGDEQIARLALSKREGDMSIFEMHYCVVGPDGFHDFWETGRHRLHADHEYRGAFKRAGLEPHFLDDGLMGRGLYLGSRSM
jgi:dTDP-3-amino-3,6-dideoxy-alpha-D-glucopyranose N,N-dimethyltransferase/dTDP-3-amino-3,4,6-trideoxy-alpha-D-glucopyranose N,N-dimethyltransferase/N-methyltransferase